MNKDLADLLRKKRGGPLRAEPDWDERRDRYIDAVELLYAEVEKFLARPIANNEIKAQRRKKNLTEPYIGTYSVDDLILLIGDEQVRFSPQGRHVAGAIGRVDVLGERAEAVLLARPGPRWTFLQSRQPTFRLKPFNESSFTKILKIVMRDSSQDSSDGPTDRALCRRAAYARSKYGLA